MKVPFQVGNTVLLAALALAQPTSPQQPEVPILASASLPTYPAILQAARLQGKVVALVTIKSGAVVKTEIESGDDRFRDPTVANLRTRRFGSGVIARITVTFTYELSGEPTDGPTKAKIEILPNLDVRVTARPRKLEEYNFS